MDQSSQDNKYMFEIAQFLGPPKIFPPAAQGKLPVAVQFIVPGLRLSNQDKKYLIQIASKCQTDLYGVNLDRAENKRTKEPATHVTLAFYIPATGQEENNPILISASRVLVERFLDLLSFFTGTKLSAVHIQPTTIGKEKGQLAQILPSVARGSTPTFKVCFPADLESMALSLDVFKALFWLRRGLAERDPIENFSSLMVCLQIMAHHLVVKPPVVPHCPSCGAELEPLEPSITSRVRELIVTKLAASPELFNRLWKARNAIVAHGNLPVTPEVFIQLTELKFDAANLAFQSIKLALGIPLDSPPLPAQAFHITDALMYID